MQTVANYSTAGLLMGEWSFTLNIIISNLIWHVEKEKLAIYNNILSMCSFEICLCINQEHK